jgi:hypothetical protein
MEQNMKNHKLNLLILCCIFLINIAVCKGDPIIDALDNSDVLVRQSALFEIQDEMLIQYSSALEERIFIQPEPFLIQEYLNTLNIIGSEHLESIALEFVDFADNFNNMEPSSDPLEAKVFATSVLFRLGNYTTTEYVFELLNRDLPVINITAFNMLEKIIINVPQYEPDSKSELISIIDNSENNDYRLYSLECLERHYGEELLDKYDSLFQIDPYWIIRMKSLEYLVKYQYEGLKPILIIQLANDPYWAFRINIAQTLLKTFGEPSDLKAVIDYQPTEQNETARSLMEYSINHFIPPKLDTINWSGLITKLISYTSEMYSYQWIANTLTRDYYISKLDLLKRQIESGRYKDACTTVNNDLLARIENDLAANNITIEGYKFLHYYCVYIKEAFSSPFQPCP